MRIDRKLHLVIPVDRADGVTVYVHSAPIGPEVFDTYFLPISKTFAEIHTQGLGVVAGPRVADKVLKKVATSLKMWDGPGGVESGLIAEIHRLTHVIAPGQKGWETIPYEEAVQRGLLDATDVSEIEGALCFFMVSSAMHRRQELEAVLQGAGTLWGARIESLDAMELMRSLPILTTDGSSGAKAA